MAQQVLVIGLGQFGMSLARTLSDRGAEVLAVDRNRMLVEEAASFVTESILLDATDEQELARLEPRKRDSAVCAIGDDSKEASIICTALLKQMGTPMIVARANDALHQRILHLVGAHQVINPEQEYGKRFANRLLYKNVIVDTSLGGDLHLTEIAVQPKMIGKNLVELSLPKRFGIMVVGVRAAGQKGIAQPSPTEPLLQGDTLIIASSESAIPRLIEVM